MKTMKRVHFRLIALLCALILCLSACGATPTTGVGTKSPSKSNSPQISDLNHTGGADGTDNTADKRRYIKKDISVTTGMFMPYYVCETESNIYAFGGQIAEPFTRFFLCSLSPDGEILTRTEEPRDTEYSINTFDYAIEDDGGIWYLESLYDVQRDADGRKISDTLLGRFIRNPDGERFEIDLSNHNGFGLCSQMIMKDDVLYVKVDETIRTYSTEGKLLGKSKDFERIYQIVSANDTVYILHSISDKYKLSILTEDASVISTVDLPYFPERLIGGAGLYTMEYKDLYKIDPETGEMEQVLNWLDCGVYEAYRDGVALKNGSFLFSADGSFNMLIPTDISLDEVKILRLATMNAEPLKKLVTDFNSTSAEYLVKLIDYSELNTKDSPENGALQLNTDIITGNAPDIVDLASLPLEQYESVGLFEDLSPYFARSDSPKMVESFMNALKRGNAIYAFVPAGDIMTIMTNADDVKGMGELGFDDILKIQEKMDRNCEPFGKLISRRDFLKAMLSVGNSKYLDWQNGTCNFDDSFKDLLRVAANMPEEAEDGYYAEEIEEGELVTYLNNVTMMPSLAFMDYRFGLNLKLNDIPSVDDGGLVLCPVFMLGMSSTSQYKEGVWQFMCMTLQDKYQNEFSIGMLPASEKGLQAFWESSNYFLSNGEFEATNSAGNVVDVPMDSPRLTALMQYAIDNVTSIYQPNPALFDIVWRESQPYFHGDKTVDEVTKTIEASAKLYISEHR